MMRTWRIGLAVLGLTAAGAQGGTTTGEGWVETYDRLLGKYVGDDGVRYQAWHANEADLGALRDVTAGIAATTLTGKTEEARLAFYLNAYNAWILKRILDDYPTDGPGGGGLFGRNRFFKSESITVAGERTSFHELEHDVIRPVFNEPRIHFALNCASASCPPLHGEAFRAEGLDGTLEGLTRAFLNDNPNGVQVRGGVAYVSKLFDWFEEDFGGKRKIRDYIAGYRSLSLPAKIRYQDYSWKLNEATR